MASYAGECAVNRLGMSRFVLGLAPSKRLVLVSLEI
jgi:hypothetical protein